MESRQRRVWNRGNAVYEITATPCMQSRQRRVCNRGNAVYEITATPCMKSIRRIPGGYTRTRDAILRGAQITYNGLCPLITYQSFGLDKKLSNPIGLLNFLEAPPGIGPGNEGFADLCLTAWLWCRLKERGYERSIRTHKWSGLRGSNPPPPPWQGGALPNELNPQVVPPVGIEPTTRGFSVPCSTN